MTKSPVALAKQAMAIAQKPLPPYSVRRSRHDFTQTQLFAIPVLREFFPDRLPRYRATAARPDRPEKGVTLEQDPPLTLPF